MGAIIVTIMILLGIGFTCLCVVGVIYICDNGTKSILEEIKKSNYEKNGRYCCNCCHQISEKHNGRNITFCLLDKQVKDKYAKEPEYYYEECCRSYCGKKCRWVKRDANE